MKWLLAAKKKSQNLQNQALIEKQKFDNESSNKSLA
jgi:hypothetical protein